MLTFISRESICLSNKQQLCLSISLNFQRHQIIFVLYKLIWSHPLSEFGNFYCISSFLFIMVKHFLYKANSSLCINQSHDYTSLKAYLSRHSTQRKKCWKPVCSNHLRNSYLQHRSIFPFMANCIYCLENKYTWCKKTLMMQTMISRLIV